ncbi:MAG: dihydroorotate dehydrogenase electron transfer subunit [Candidatus Zixiibacteriota bacterium]|nr:MAG: dihydroorotate dehydrogenase electron transfer subunit [candidate division Zixibacteria bacterium]
MTRILAETTEIRKHLHLGQDYYRLTLGPLRRAKRCRPGQFVHIQLPGTDILFRRAMSVAAVDSECKTIDIIMKAVGRGTGILAGYTKGSRVNVLGPLGKPFSLPKKSETSLLVAGGVGFPPLFYLATEMVSRGHNPDSIQFFYGGRSSGDILEKSKIRRLGLKLHVVTEDGSAGSRGLVIEEVERFIDAKGEEKMRLVGCGPMGMLKAVDELGMRHGILGEISLEAPMPCGIGVCLGCVVPLRKGGHARVCREGPVFDIGEVVL